MNKLIKFTMAAAIAAVFATTAVAQPLPLNEVIERSARGVEEALPQGAMVAILNFASPSEAFSGHVIEELISELSEVGKITVVDRQNLEHITQEMVLQLSGAVSDESMLSVGKMLGAHYIISGTATEIGAYYRFRVRIINVETAAIQKQITHELKVDSQVASLMGIKPPKPPSIPTSNVKDNWVSAELSGGYVLFTGPGLSIGARYERMLSSKMSLGANFYWFIPSDEYGDEDERYDSFIVRYELERGNIFGAGAFIRFYPTEKMFFWGLGLGYHDCGSEVTGYNDNRGTVMTEHGAGFGITGELGLKKSIAKEGGFFLQSGLLGTFIIGRNEYSYYGGSPSPSDIEDEDRMFFGGYWRLYLGAGWAF